MNKFVKTTVAGLVAFGMQTATTAVTSADYDLVVRSGPGYYHPIRAIIRNNETIRFNLCNPVWCHISNSQVQGWVRTNTITANPEIFAYPERNTGTGGIGNKTAGNIKNGHSLTIKLKIIRPVKTAIPEK